MKTKQFYFMILTICSLTFFSCEESCSKKTCSDYSTQAAAQADYDSDPDCYGNLDRDDDGIACEN